MEQIKAHIAVSLDGHTATPSAKRSKNYRWKILFGCRLPAYGGKHLQLHL